MLLQQEIARVHTCAKCEIARIEVRIITHTPYSSDSAPSNFFLFSSMKNGLPERYLSQTRTLSPKKKRILNYVEN